MFCLACVMTGPFCLQYVSPVLWKQLLLSGSVGGHAAAYMPWSLWFCLLFSFKMPDHEERSVFNALFSESAEMRAWGGKTMSRLDCPELSVSRQRTFTFSCGCWLLAVYLSLFTSGTIRSVLTLIMLLSGKLLITVLQIITPLIRREGLS